MSTAIVLFQGSSEAPLGNHKFSFRDPIKERILQGIPLLLSQEIIFHLSQIHCERFRRQQPLMPIFCYKDVFYTG